MKHSEPHIIVWLLLTLFVGLKLTNQIEWHWGWIVAPVWIWYVARFMVAFITAFIVATVQTYRKRHGHRL